MTASLPPLSYRSWPPALTSSCPPTSPPAYPIQHLPLPLQVLADLVEQHIDALLYPLFVLSLGASIRPNRLYLYSMHF